MEMLLLGIAVGFVLCGLLVFVVLSARAGSVNRAWWALELAGRAKQEPAFAAALQQLQHGGALPAAPAPSHVAEAPKITPSVNTQPLSTNVVTATEGFRVLSLLQTEARLIDFLMEDVSAFSDEQIGQGVRDVHKKASAALKKHLDLVPVLPGSESESVTVQAGFDPSAIQLTGQVTGNPPFRGTLVHPGWRVAKSHVPPPPTGQDASILQPAEVELP